MYRHCVSCFLIDYYLDFVDTATRGEALARTYAGQKGAACERLKDKDGKKVKCTRIIYPFWFWFRASCCSAPLSIIQVNIVQETVICDIACASFCLYKVKIDMTMAIHYLYDQLVLMGEESSKLPAPSGTSTVVETRNTHSVSGDTVNDCYDSLSESASVSSLDDSSPGFDVDLSSLLSLNNEYVREHCSTPPAFWRAFESYVDIWKWMPFTYPLLAFTCVFPACVFFYSNPIKYFIWSTCGPSCTNVWH